jgi:hypothetical protein
MPSQIVNTEWLNANSMRRYPLSEEATAYDITSSFKLPDDFIVDAIIPVHATLNLEVSKFHIQQVVIFGSGVVVTLAYDGTPFASVTISSANFETNTTYFFSGTGDFEDVQGKVTIGKLDELLQSGGAYEFDVDGGRLEERVIVPDIRGVTGVRILTADDLSELIQGDIAFEAGSNMRITASTAGGISVLTFDAIDGEGTVETCDCDDFSDAECIKSLNGVLPDENGNIDLVGDDCIEITPGDARITLDDKCSKSCCGCPELEVVIQDLKDVRDQVNTLTIFAGRLDAVVAALQVVVASLSSSSST